MNHIKKLSELALIRALPDFIIGKLKPGRLKNKCDRLIRLIDAEIIKIPKITTKDAYDVKLRMQEFGKRTGWENKERHVVTLVSFHLAMIEESEFEYDPKIGQYLTDIFDYFERKEGSRPICYVAGDIAMTKWKEINE